MSDIPTSIRTAVRARERERCAVCWGPGTDIHHRQRRRDGGHTLANCVLLCRGCHSAAHHNPQDAREAGLIVSAYEQDPSTVPMFGVGGWRRYHEDGTVTIVPMTEGTTR